MKKALSKMMLLFVLFKLPSLSLHLLTHQMKVSTKRQDRSSLSNALFNYKLFFSLSLS